MAANMMDILKQMNRNISIIDRKILELDKKMDQQQIITKSLAQQVKNSNTLLFGNEEASIHFHNNTTDKSHLVDEKEKADLVDQPEEYIENTETKRLQDPPKISFNCICQTYCQDDNNKNYNKDTQHIDLQSISNELSEIKDYLRNFAATKITVGEAMSLDKDRYFNADQISKLTEELKQKCDEIKDFIRDSGVTELSEIKDYLRNFEATKVTDGKAMSLEQDRYFNADQISKLSEELKRNCDEMKDFIRDSGVSKKTIGVVVSSDNRDTVQISPTYFNEEQISKLNEELKRIAEIYRSTNIPVIEVVPGCEHPIMEQLRKGLKYKSNAYMGNRCIKIKFGVNGYKRSEVQELLNENPDLMLSEVVKELLISKGWKLDLVHYKLNEPFPYDL